MSSPALDAALRWLRRGAAPIPLPYGSKAAITEGWPALTITRENAPEYFDNGNGPVNLGIHWGKSGPLVDVDIDHPAIAPFIDGLLPATSTYGRTSAPRTHRIYRSPGAPFRRYDVPRRIVPGIEG